MPKNLGRYDNDLSVPRKKDIDALTLRVDTNEDNIAMAESDIEGLQTDVGTLKTDVSQVKTALNSKQNTITGGASTITDTNLTANRALVSNGSGKVAVSEVTATELGYLDGVTSNVQTQLNKKLETAPVTSVNGQTGDVTIKADIPDNLVKYTAVSDVQSVDGLNADTLEGHNAAYFATAAELSTVDGKVSTNTNNIATLSTGLSMANGNITTLQEGKLNKSGGTMTGALVAQNNVDYTTSQVRNVIISTADPSGGSSGMLWIKYTP